MMRRLTFAPGVDTESTATASRGGWNSSNLIRFRSGFLERIRGWRRLLDDVLTGVCRCLHYWTDLNSRQWLAAGTNEKLYAVDNGFVIHDITPVAGFTPGAVSSGAIPFSLLIWSLDNFGQVGMFCPTGQGIFSWTPSLPTVPAALIATAPPKNRLVLVTMPQQIVMACGSSPDAGALDSLLIRWSAQSDYTDWTPSATNQAGSFRLPRGNLIVGAIQAGLATYIWTDFEFWTAQYSGFPFVFGFFQQGASCGLIAQNAVAALGVVTYWMGDHGFFLTTGTGFQQIPCSVWDYVYLDIDQQNQDKCLAASNYHYREVMFFFPSLSLGSGEIDSYVKFNVMENVWDTGRLVRTAWTDVNPSSPIGVDQNHRLQRQDVGYNADDVPMVGVSAISGYLDVSDGSDIVLVTRIIPDALWEGPTPSFDLTLLVRSFPGDDPVECGPFRITPGTDFVSVGRLTPVPILGVRGREVAFKITCDEAGSWFRLGVFRATVGAAGRL